jgi:hypothetical protein
LHRPVQAFHAWGIGAQHRPIQRVSLGLGVLGPPTAMDFETVSKH